MKCVHDLSDHDQGRITGVIIHIFQSHIHSMFIVVPQYLKVIAAGIEGRLQQIKMDRRHLRAEDRVVFPHLFREGNLLDGRGADRPLHIPHLPHPEGGKERTDTDSCRTQIVDFIDL